MNIVSTADIDKTRPEPLYLQIKNWMMREISSGRWPEHAKLPAEEDLAHALDVSRGTLRKALQELIALGQLKQSHGKGTFVASGGHVEQRLADQLITVSEEFSAAHIQFTTEVLEQAVIQPSQRIGSMLAIPHGDPVFYLKRLRKVNGKPLIVFKNYVVLGKCPEIIKMDFTQFQLFYLLEKHFSLKLDWGNRTFEAQMADSEIAALLAMKPDTATLYMEQVVYLSDGSPIEMSDVWFRGDSFRLTATLKRHAVSSVPSSMLEYAASASANSKS